MAAPEITVDGRARREVIPDRVVVSVTVRTRVLPTAREALADCAARRRRLLDALAAARPGAEIRDGRIDVREHQVRVKDRASGETVEHWEVRGHFGRCVVEAEEAADEAAALVAAAGALPEATAVHPRFHVSPALSRAVDGELQQGAARDGVARAEAIAAALGVEAGGLLSVAESRGGGYEPRMALAAYSAEPPGDPDDIAADLGELRPDPVTMEAVMTVRMAIA
jgi:uncharacterized protein YggE